ncbi:MAG TPA: hypothetical protein P5273_07865 [Syntrophomonadaceae bacterium]|jgi:hypothetical protein|nr:hypothetical protein [Syntrophomonadaceae bacterium]
MQTTEIVLGIIILALILVLSRGTRRIVFLIIFILLVAAKIFGY